MGYWVWSGINFGDHFTNPGQGGGAKRSEAEPGSLSGRKRAKRSARVGGWMIFGRCASLRTVFFVYVYD